MEFESSYYILQEAHQGMNYISYFIYNYWSFTLDLISYFLLKTLFNLPFPLKASLRVGIADYHRCLHFMTTDRLRLGSTPDTLCGQVRFHHNVYGFLKSQAITIFFIFFQGILNRLQSLNNIPTFKFQFRSQVNFRLHCNFWL